MPEKIKYSLSVQVVGGPSIPVTGEITPDAYEKMQIAVAAGAGDLEVNIQPSGTSLGQFLLIKASAYADSDASHKLTYKVNDKSGTAMTLDAPHLFIGKGAVGLLGTSPTKLFISSSLTAEVTIDILVGRDATP